MSQFLRALKDSLRHWRALLLATLCSAGVAAVWGGNIGAFFPIIEVTLAGEPLQTWVVREIQSAEKAIEEAHVELAQLRQQLPLLPADERRRATLQIDRLLSRIESEERAVRSYEWIQPYIDRFLPPEPQQTVLLVVLLLVVSTAIKHVLLLVNTMLVANVSNSIARDIRQSIFRQAIHMDRRGFTGYSASGFTAQITQSTEMLATGITAVFGGAIREPLKLIACLVGASLICCRLLFISLVVVPLVGLLIFWLGRRLKTVCGRLLRNAASLHHVMSEAFGNIQTVQAYGMEGIERERFQRATDRMFRFALKIAFYNGLSRPITELLGVGMIATTIIAGSYLVLNQETHVWGVQICDRPLSVTSMLVFFGLLVGATDPVRKMSVVVSGVNTGAVAATMIYKLLDRIPRIRDPATPKSISKPHRLLQIKDVCFGYRPKEFILQDVCVEIPFGTTVAIVGPNGCGKSSLVNLLCRFYDPQQGAIRADGVDIRHLALSDLRSRIGLVTQRTELFNESILYNIKYGSLDRSDDDVIEAAKLAHAHEFISSSLPERYETIVGSNGHRLSGGQRQRVALARALLREPEILILDEATSQIDRQSEQLIQAAIRKFSGERTVIMITHRASILELADVVIELDGGRVVSEEHRRQHAA